MTIKELYEEAKKQNRENYDFAICSTDDVNIYIDLAYQNIVPFLSDFFHNGSHHPAGTAPGCPEVQQHGFGILQNHFFKIGACDVQHKPSPLYGFLL